MIRAPMSAAVSQINRLFVEGTISGLSDGQLLERFLDRRDESAFAELVERHGPMVFCTCRAVVRDNNAAEDAFQATFLVLVCKARTIRGRDALGGWLHRVAYRVALQASADAALRRGRERSVADLLVEDQTQEAPDEEAYRVLHEEVARLSEKYRLPVLLCDLEGKTHVQAARELNCGEATVQRRRARAHELLRSRLARRGISLTVAALIAALSRSADACVSTTCSTATIKAATQMATTAMRIAIGEVVSTNAATLVRKSLRGMLIGELGTIGSAALVLSALTCIAWGFALTGQADGRPGGAMAKTRTVPASLPDRPKVDRPNDPGEMITYQGRVLDPEGHPFAGASLYLNTYGLKQPHHQPVRAASGADGQFRFAVSRSEFDNAQDDAPWSFCTIVARAKGFAFGAAYDRGDAKELTLQLARDDVPICGRVFDLEGRPVAGVIVKVRNVRVTATGSLDGWLKALEERKELSNLEHEFLPNGLQRQVIPFIIPAVSTDGDGTFRIEGVGRDRVANLQIEGPTIETKLFEVRTRPGEPIRVPAFKSIMNPDLKTIYGSRFEHVAAPTRPIEGVVRDQDTGKPLAGIMVRGDQSLTTSSSVFVHTLTNQEGKYSLVGLPQGRAGYIVAVPPCDFPIYGSDKADLKVPRDEELPYRPARVPIADTRGTGVLHLDIRLKRGVWVTGRVIDKATGKPVPAQVKYFVYRDNPNLKEFPTFGSTRLGPYFVFTDGRFGLVALPGPGVLAVRANEDRYIRGAGVETFKHKPEDGFGTVFSNGEAVINYHVLAEIDPTPGSATLTRDLLLETGRSLTITALAPDGRPLTEMKVSGLKDMAYWETAPPDASIHTITSLKAGKGRTLTFLNERGRLVGELVLRGDETAPQKVTLQPWGTLTGRVVNADGEPWGEGEIHSVILPNGYPKIGKDGRFRIEGLVPGKLYTLYLVSGFRVRGTIVDDIKLGSGEVRDLGEIVPVAEGKRR